MHVERKIHDFLTLLMPTAKLLTQAGFELAPSVTLVRRSTIINVVCCVGRVEIQIEI